jgi:hypothetical protein
MKAVAGNLGIGRIFSAAGSLEKAIRESDPATAALVLELGSLLKNQIDAIERALPGPAPGRMQKTTIGSSNAREAFVAVCRLREMLKASDGESEEAFSVFNQAAASAVDKPKLEALGASVSEFDFESALLKLNEIVQLYGLSEQDNE